MGGFCCREFGGFSLSPANWACLGWAEDCFSFPKLGFGWGALLFYRLWGKTAVPVFLRWGLEKVIAQPWRAR